jgi:hypothetical protein
MMHLRLKFMSASLPNDGGESSGLHQHPHWACAQPASS